MVLRNGGDNGVNVAASVCERSDGL